MINRRTLSWVGLILLSAGFLVIFGRVMEMRISSGDIYPHYATLRNDPLGCSALYDSFTALEGYTVEQNMAPLTAVKGIDGDTALLLLGLPWDSFKNLRARDDSPVIRAVKDDGARLVITLNPQIVQESFRKKNSEEEDDWIERRRKLRDKLRREREDKKEENSNDKKEEDGENDDLSEEEIELEQEAILSFGTTLSARLSVEIPDLGDYKRPEDGWETKAGKSAHLPSDTPNWFSQYRLQANDEAWKEIVLIDGVPVVLERRFGKGTVVLATDTFFASNESLHEGGNPEFLMWLTGGKKRIVFDETIHGSVQAGGAMMLIRRYQLHGVFFGLFIFIGLWAWRSATSLTPGDEAVDRGLVGGSAVSGEQNNSGFVRLLKRSVPGKELISQCLDIWRKSQTSHISPEQEKQVSSIVSLHQEDPKKHSIAETYQAISKVLKKH